ncbi:MAG: S41 family peptidase [Acidobacteriota bacterium]|nr:S41 family peptidase [Acidobacteriota bacterium]
MKSFKSSRFVSFALMSLFVFLFSLSASPTAFAQTLENEKGRGRDILDAIKKDIVKNYYDPTFGGKDMDAIFKSAEERINKATAIGQILGVVAQTLMQFDDSHTYFVPPAPADSIQHGWEMQLIGDKCYVVAVKQGSDAEAKGLKPGDEILVIGGYTPMRKNLQNLLFFLKSAKSMKVLVKRSDGATERLEVMAKVRAGKRVLDLRSPNPGADISTLIREAENDAFRRHRYYDIGDEGIIWRMPTFNSDKVIDDLMEKAKGRKFLILDLRGNGGGYETALQRLTGYFFDRDVKIGDLKSRKESKTLTAKTRGKNVFTGKLIVLVDGESGSASELFARVVQLEKRGTIVGDQTPGVVMQGTYFPHKSGLDLVFYYGVSVTTADLIMTDGKSLERVGVTPDERLIPTPEDLAAGRDPVLSRAATLVGLKIEPEKAGQMFPVEWRP